MSRGYEHFEQPPPEHEQDQIVVVQQPNNYVRTYDMPRAVRPGALMVVCGILNKVVLIVLGVMTGAWASEYILGMVIFLACGIVALIGSAGSRAKTSQGPPICLIILSIASLVFSGVQIVLRALGIIASVFIASVETNDPDSKQVFDLIGSILLWTSVGLIVIAVLAFILSIVLIVFASQVLCSCCGAPDGSSTRVVYQHKF